MELWVRSQDKRILQKVDNIFLDANYENKRISTYDGDNVELGTYKTKERAIEVLDEIQNILKPKFKLDTSSIQENGRSWVENAVILQNYTANADFIKLDTYVYEMPKD